LDHASHFRLWQRGADHAALVLGAGGDADTIGRFLISDRKKPSRLPWHGDYAVLPANSRRAVIMSTTHLPFVEVLGALGNVLACAWPERSRSATVQEALAAGRLVPLFQNNEARREQLVAISPDVVLDHPFGQPRPPTDLAGTWVPICEYLEAHPLARAEWIRFFGVLFGERAKADSMYFAIQARYLRTAALVAAAATHHPKVFFGSAWQGSWSVPPGNSYMARLIQDAGGEYLYAGQMAQGNLDLHMETVLADAHRSEQWGMIVDVAHLRGRAGLPGMDARLAAALTRAKGHVFIANSAEADLFGLALLEPERAVADLIAIFHPELLPDHTPVYYRPLLQ